MTYHVKKSVNISKEWSEFIMQKTDNAMAKGKQDKNTINDPQYIWLNTNGRGTRMPRKTDYNNII